MRLFLDSVCVKESLDRKNKNPSEQVSIKACVEETRRLKRRAKFVCASTLLSKIIFCMTALAWHTWVSRIQYNNNNNNHITQYNNATTRERIWYYACARWCSWWWLRFAGLIFLMKKMMTLLSTIFFLLLRQLFILCFSFLSALFFASSSQTKYSYFLSDIFLLLCHNNTKNA